MRISYFLLTAIFIALQNPLYAQEAKLSKEDAVKLTLENNFGIVIANNDVKIAANNKGILNSRFLPALTANSGASYDKNNQEATFQDGSVSVLFEKKALLQSITCIQVDTDK